MMKALHRRLPVAVGKRLYDPSYPSLLCLRCGAVEASDHAFFCPKDEAARQMVSKECAGIWMSRSGAGVDSSTVLHTLYDLWVLKVDVAPRIFLI
ncbi:hypothetical protein G9A89_009835 [Geosiphon pyriformis]|nr:hypothetical protein G9A89_009835 [Geosiphon pyriformis]